MVKEKGLENQMTASVPVMGLVKRSLQRHPESSEMV
jgi:hypothetical protein